MPWPCAAGYSRQRSAQASTHTHLVTHTSPQGLTYGDGSCVWPGPSILRVVVVGGGYSGVELAANLAERLGKDR
jgi:NADH dehydrogenase FAD-containing subunit